jgi:phage gpG-like protein
MGAEQVDLLANELFGMARELHGMEREVLTEVAQEMAAQTRRNLDESIDTFGRPFLPLKSGSGRRPLMKTGALYRAVRGHVQGNAAVVVCDVPYAGIQNRGGTISKPARQRDKPWVFMGRGGGLVFTRRIRAHTVTIPARQFMGTGNRMITACVKVVLDFSDRLLRRR